MVRLVVLGCRPHCDSFLEVEGEEHEKEEHRHDVFRMTPCTNFEKGLYGFCCFRANI